jgi:hypothetical protein
VPGARDFFRLTFDPVTGQLTNEDGTSFPDTHYSGTPDSQGIIGSEFFTVSGDDGGNSLDYGGIKFKMNYGARDQDSDGDGLLDTWETWGINAADPDGPGPLVADPNGPVDLTRHPDLRLPGANPDHKDLYVEVDAMQAAGPTGPAPAAVATEAAAIAKVVDAFAAVPNDLLKKPDGSGGNPDGQQGITLHAALDETNIPWDTWATVDASNWPTGFDAIKKDINASPGHDGSKADFAVAGGFGTVAEQQADPDRTTILAAKRLAYRYAIFGDQYAQSTAGVVALTTSSGDSEVGGNDLMVTLGSWTPAIGGPGTVPGGTVLQQAATFMHELGHTLGLTHDGGQGSLPGQPDAFNWKPNYHSIMNYTWQMPFIAPPIGATPAQIGFQNSWTLDYSRQALNVLTEGSVALGTGLNETAGIGGKPGNFVQIGPGYDAAGNPIAVSLVSESGPVDFNGDGTSNGFPVVDINFLGDANRDSIAGNAADQTPGQTLLPAVDWNRLQYGWDRSAAADGVHSNVTPHELTLQEFLAFSDKTAPVSTLTVGSPQFPVGATQPFVTSGTPFSISATDDASGVYSLSYRYFLEGSTAPAFTRVTGASAQFTLAGADGTYQVEMLATDKAGNAETAHVQLVKLDNTAPVITVNQPAATEYAHSAILTLNYTVNDGAGSGVKSFTPKLDGATALAGHGLQSGQAITLLTELALGTHTFTIAASDNLQNSSEKSVTFEVIVTPESIKEDVNFFLNAGNIKNKGLANSLLATLNSAASAIGRGQGDTAVNIYGAFINELNAQSGKGVDATAAKIMIDDAGYLIAHIDRFLPVVV